MQNRQAIFASEAAAAISRLMFMPILVSLLLCFFGISPAANVYGESSLASISNVLLHHEETPHEIAVDFDQPLNLLLVRMQVVDQAGIDHSVGRPIVRTDRRRISVEVDRMHPGVFTVQWSVVELGGKRTEGSYTFELRTEEILCGSNRPRETAA